MTMKVVLMRKASDEECHSDNDGGFDEESDCEIEGVLMKSDSDNDGGVDEESE